MSDGLGNGPARTLRAGPLTLAYEGAGVRWIRLGQHEVLRGIYVAVRDEHWRTIPAAIRDLSIDAREDTFRIELSAAHERLDVDFRWHGTIVGERSGTITFAMDGAAQRTFRKNRIGICVLHPMAECAGRPCTVEHVDGHIASTSFPTLVSPLQALREVRAVAHEVATGVIAEVRLDGDTFETEDQRNWSDTSFKTYSTPVDRPFPVEVAAGTSVRQEVRLRLRGPVHVRTAPTAEEAAPDDVVRITLTGERRAMPRLGLLIDPTQPLSAQESTRLRALGLSQLRVDLDLGEPHWHAALSTAAAQAVSISLPLHVAALVPDAATSGTSAGSGTSGRLGTSATDLHAALPALAALATAAASLPASPIEAWLIFDRATGTTPASLLSAARELLANRDAAIRREATVQGDAPIPRRAGVRIGGGSNVHFADLNRNRPPGELLDLVTWPMSPQAHAVDVETMVENIGSIASVVETARSFAPGVPVAISPVTLRPRPRPGSTVPPPLGALPDHIDARQMGPFAAAWTISHFGAAAAAGVESVTYFRTVGWDGVMEREDGSPRPDAFPSRPGMAFPVYHALADLGAFADGRVLVTRSSDSRRVDALCLERDGLWRLLLVNLRAERQRVQLPPMIDARGTPALLDLDGHAIIRLDFDAPPKNTLKDTRTKP